MAEPGLGPPQRPVLAHPDAVPPAPAHEGERVPGGVVVGLFFVFCVVLLVGQFLLGHRRLVGGLGLDLAVLWIVGDFLLVMGGDRSRGQPRDDEGSHHGGDDITGVVGAELAHGQPNLASRPLCRPAA